MICIYDCCQIGMVCIIILQIVNLLKQEVKTSGKMYFLCLYFHKHVSNNSLTFISILIGNLDFFWKVFFVCDFLYGPSADLMT